MRAETNKPQLLVVTTTWYPGWQAFVDGNPGRCIGSNGSFMAVPVPAGAHEVACGFSRRVFSFWSG